MKQSIPNAVRNLSLGNPPLSDVVRVTMLSAILLLL